MALVQVDLTPLQTKELAQAYAGDGQDTLDIDYLDNLVSTVDSWRALRYFPLPLLDKTHFPYPDTFETPGHAVLMQGSGYYLLLDQRWDWDSTPRSKRTASVVPSLVLESTLPFLKVPPTTPEVINAATVDYAQWMCDRIAQIPTAQRDRIKLWKVLLEEAAGISSRARPFFGADAAVLLDIIDGRTTAQQAFGAWQTDANPTAQNLAEQGRMRQLVAGLANKRGP